jgi:two-component system, LuxR family, response regulator FixJ
MSHQRTVYVLDADLETRRSLTLQLAAIGAEAWPIGSGGEFLEIMAHLMPACILLDMDMVEPAGIDVLAALKRSGSHWPVLAMSARPEVAAAVEAMKLGALDFLEKPIQAPKLAAALLPAWTMLEATVQEAEIRRDAQERFGRLTVRELDIAMALFAGSSNKGVAHELGISVRTVEMHRAHIMAKLAVRSIAEAAVMATQAGLAPRRFRPQPATAPAAASGALPFARGAAAFPPRRMPLRTAV